MINNYSMIGMTIFAAGIICYIIGVKTFIQSSNKRRYAYIFLAPILPIIFLFGLLFLQSEIVWDKFHGINMQFVGFVLMIIGFVLTSEMLFDILGDGN